MARRVKRRRGGGWLACELIVEVYYQRVVPPVKGGEKVKETKEAHLRRTEEYRETALQINGTGN